MEASPPLLFARVERDSMTRPLTRKTGGGAAYARPKGIEESIEPALRLPPDTLRRRAKIRARVDPEYLPSECLVHLIRDAGRKRDFPLVTDLMQALSGRCAAILLKRFPDAARGAAEIREAVLAKLNERVLEDVRDENRDDLDFYEVRFNAAFSTLWKDASEKVWTRMRREAPLPQPGPERKAAPKTGGRRAWDEQAPEEPRDVFALRRLPAAMAALSEPEREAVRLRYFEGLEVESKDPNEVTVATTLRVSGRTVRARLARAHAAMREMMETDHG